LGLGDPFLCKYDTAGIQSWCYQFGTAAAEYASGISAESTRIHVSGRIQADAFLAKLDPRTPGDLLRELVAMVVALNLKTGVENSLDGKLQAALQALDDANQNNNAAAMNTLPVFIDAVERQRGIELSDDDADRPPPRLNFPE
jgi:hypothetical protein